VNHQVRVDATIENLYDLWDAERGHLPVESVRRLALGDALVNPGDCSLIIPGGLIQKLGLQKRQEKRVCTSTGMIEVNVYDPVRLTIHGRDCTVDVIENSDDLPVVIGDAILGYLDLVVDSDSRRVIGNPAHGGEQIIELYTAAMIR